MPRPLEPLRVLDLTTGMSTAVATMLLADYGAEVIKVETAAGDMVRRYGLHRTWHRGKRSLLADLDDAADLGLVQRLAAEADVVLAPATLRHDGLTAAALRAANPSLLHVTVRGYGAATPWADRPAHPALVAARLGLNWNRGGVRPDPTGLGHPGIEYTTAYLTAITVLAGVHATAITGTGQNAEVSLLDGALTLFNIAWGSPKGRLTTESAGKLDTGLRRLLLERYECSDGKWLMIHTGAAGGFARALRLFGLDDRIPADVGAVEMASELTPEQHSLLYATLPGIFRTKPRDEWLETLWAGELAALPLQPLGECFDDPQVRHQQLVRTVDDPELGPIDVVGPPIHVHAVPGPMPGAAPAVGADTDEIRRSGWRSERAPVSNEPRPLAHPLEGVRVLDLGAYMAGPFGSRVLADLGADVIKVEPKTGDPMRPLMDLFEGIDQGKRALALDLKHPDAAEIVRRLLLEADVLHHNLRPGAAERVGIGWEQVRAINPELVYLHAPGYGTSGPKSMLQSFAPLHSGFVGMFHEAGGEGNDPIRAFGNEDHYNGLLGATSMLLGLLARQRSGTGLQLLAPQLHSSLLATSHVVRREGTRVPTLPPLDHGQFGRTSLDRFYRCREGWLAIGCSDAHDAVRLVDALGIGDRWRDRLRADLDCSAEVDGELATDIAAVLATDTADAWFARLDAAGAPCEVVLERIWDSWVFDDPGLRAAGQIDEVVHPSWGPIRRITNTLHFESTPAVTHPRAPLMGEHSTAVLREHRFDDADIDRWRAEGVITQVDAP